MNSPPMRRKVASLLDFTQVETIYQLDRRDLVLKTARVKRDPAIIAGLERAPRDWLLYMANAIYAELDDDQEHFTIITCDAGQRPYGFKVIASGSVEAVDVPTRIIWRHAYLLGAQGLVLIHNHPSAHLRPSLDDLILTQRLRAQASILAIDILDHLIYSPETGVLSLRAEYPELWPAWPAPS